MVRMARVNVSLIGGEHQFLHIVPVAAWLSAQGAAVTLFTRDAAGAAAAAAMMRALGAGAHDVVAMERSRTVRAWLALAGRRRGKGATLIAWHGRLRACDALLTAERTTAWLTRLPGRQPLYIRFTHGVGDRAKGFSRAARRYDFFIVAGAKYAARFVAAGIAPRARIAVTGYIKIPALRRLRHDRPRLFADPRPVVVYNPHFDQSVSSWSLAGHAVIAAILAADRWNLIVAPHVRLFAEAPAAERERVMAYAAHPRCLVDLGSSASSDMTYVDAAAIYVGDVSSQVYEFLADPRPCVFVNAHRVAWADDENYRMWRLGEVIGDPAADLAAALARAPARHAGYRAAQAAAAADALGDMRGDPAARAGQVVLDLIARRPPSTRA